MIPSEEWKTKYWSYVETALLILEAPQALADSFRNEVDDLPTPQQALFYHAEPFDVAVDLAVVENASTDQMHNYLDFNDPKTQRELKSAASRAFNKYPDNAYDSWEDLAHDVFIRCKSSLSQYRKKATTTTYLYKIAINLLIDAHRKANAQKRPPGKALNLEDIRPIRDETYRQIEDQVLIKELLEPLDPEERRLFVGWGLQERRLKEMADELGITTATMSIRLNKMLDKIRRRLNS